MPHKPKNETGVPDYAIDAMARAFLPVIQAYYSTQSEGPTETEDRQKEKCEDSESAS